ncbi:NAD-dependent epimerase/dehydratase family protein [Deinococcus aquatilis]|uniref:NAD-dependent epimerase/dehydratase family protein n=1 Tax=Deinococcus aquatilis TaxID=519440 RepID=UPI00036A7D2A|nr:NAD-dependent epimerase/dehydratase family protein [Deinococcus aquatilis]
MTESAPQTILITGSAGFVGSHLVERFLNEGHTVIGVDNYISGQRQNTALFLQHPRFRFIQADVSQGIPYTGDTLDWVLHFASPASPPHYQEFPVETLMVGAQGTQHGLELALKHGAKFFLASTSEVYGDPHVHPQPESYWGHVNPNGLRSCYDEAKRYAEAMTMAYHRAKGVDTRIIRIFNTYGPRMRADDGRVITNFVHQALRGEALTIYGDGLQTRSFQYVDDLVEGIVRLMGVSYHEPVNLGNPTEFTMLELADVVREIIDPELAVVYQAAPSDDPQQRKPDISRAQELLGWTPQVALAQGLSITTAAFREDRIKTEQAAHTPLVSVVIPTRNRPDLLLQRAVRTALAQTLHNIEVIVVIDGPDPATVQALSEVPDSRLRVLALPDNIGAAEARNIGIRAAQAEWIALLDDDDEWAPEKLERQLEAARASAHAQPIVVCRYFLPTPQGTHEEPPRFPRAGEAIGDYLMARDAWLSRDRTLMSTVLFARRELFLQVPFDPALRRHQDWDWLLRVAGLPGVGFEGVSELLATYHFHEPRPHMSLSAKWSESLKWAEAHYRDGRLSQRAYVGFIVFHVSQFAANDGTAKAFWSTSRAVLSGRPRPFEVGRYVATWVFPQQVRRRIHVLAETGWAQVRPPRRTERSRTDIGQTDAGQV